MTTPPSAQDRPDPSPGYSTPHSSILRWVEHLGAVSSQFAMLAQWVEAELPTGEEKSAALRHLLIAKDAAVRAALDAKLLDGR